MNKLTVDGNTVIYLNHLQLINDAYATSAHKERYYYELKSELFAFNAKKEKNKNKHKDKEDTSSDDLLILWHTLSQKAIKFLQDQSVFKAEEQNDIVRYWEEVHEFPNYHGANRTNKFEKFTFNTHNNISYIVPPNCTFFNHNIMELTQLLPQLQTGQGFDLIVIDPPWRNKYIRRVKKARFESAYTMLDTDQLKCLPLQTLVHENTIVAIWCTNSPTLQQALSEELLPAWSLKLMHSMPWFKLNTTGQLICTLKKMGTGKQPFEMLFIATHKHNKEFAELQKQITNVQMLLSIPSIVHSHKPPLLHWLQEYLGKNQENTRCLELFARYLQPNFTSIGLEVLKLMDGRLYRQKETALL